MKTPKTLSTITTSQKSTPKQRIKITHKTLNIVAFLADQREDIYPPSDSKQKVIPNPNEVGLDKFHEIMTQDLSRSHLVLLQYLHALPKREIIELMAIVWFGRGDANFSDVLIHAKKSYNETTAYYLAEKLILSDYLHSGVRQLSVMGILSEPTKSSSKSSLVCL